MKPNEIHISRVYDAPVKFVWDAWTDLKQVAQWWGPRGFTITTHSKDLRNGGHWSYTMHGPDGTNYENRTTYHVVEKYSRLEYDHGANETQPALFRVTVTFEEVKGKTKMEMTMACKDVEAAVEIKKHIKQANGNSTWDRLGEYLAKNGENKEIFIINRSFQAPIEVMFNVWTDPNHISKWLAPKGFEMQYHRAEIKAGAEVFYSMSGHGMKMFGKARYLEIEKPTRIVYTQQFCDENEKVSRHPMAPTWPETMRTTITFTAEEANQTRVTIRWEVVGNATETEMDTFIKGRSGMTMGWTGSFDKLDEYLLAL